MVTRWGVDPFRVLSGSTTEGAPRVVGGGWGGLVRPDGRDLEQLTRSGADPDWSPDGKRIVFDTPKGIVLVDRNGSHLRQLTTHAGDGEPDWSPTGSYVVFSRAADLWIMRADGSHQAGLIAKGREPSWQPLR